MVLYDLNCYSNECLLHCKTISSSFNYTSPEQSLIRVHFLVTYNPGTICLQDSSQCLLTLTMQSARAGPALEIIIQI